MHIILVSQEYPPETASGGIGTQAFCKAHGLAARGHVITVLSSTPGEKRTETHDGAVRVIRLPTAALPQHTEEARWLAYSSLVATALLGMLRDDPADLIDFAEYAGEGYVYLLNRTEWNYVPVTVQIHGPIVMYSEIIGWPE